MPTDPSYTPAADIARDRDHLISRFIATRSQSEQIAGRLSVEDQQVQSMPDVSPTKWHLAHVTWFFETFVLKPHAPGYDEFDRHSAICSIPITKPWGPAMRDRIAAC